MSVPIDVILKILEYCTLEVRYQCSCLSTDYFPFKERDWIAYGNRYGLVNATRYRLRSLCLREYSSQFSISRRLNSLWSHHFKAPLEMWTPWTLRRNCRRSPKKMDFYFCHYHFVNFVRELGRRFKLKTGCLKKRNLHDCVVSTVWVSNTKRLEMVFNPGRRRRYCTKTFLKPYSKARALLKYYVSHGNLSLKIQKLEFWV